MVVNKIAKVSGIIYRLKEFFPSYIIKQLYHSLVSPHLNYCITAWGGISRNILQPLIVMQKRLVRIITSSDYLAHTSPLFQSLSILKLEDVYKFSLMNMMFQTLTLNKFPTLRQKIIQEQSVHRYRTRNSNLTLPFVRVKKCEQSYIYQGVKLWNTLPAYLKALLSVRSFKRSYTNLLLSAY